MLSLGSNISATQVVESKYSASFDGIDDFIDTNQTFQSVFRGDFSISFWVKPSDGRCSEMIFGVDNDSNDDGNSGDRAEIYFQLQGDGSPRFVFTASADVGEWDTTGNGGFAFSDGAQSSWTHFVVTMNLQSSGNSIGKIYVNGVDKTTEQANIPSADHADYTSDLSLLLAARSVEGSALNHYEGGLDEFAIFNTVLDSDAVTAIYNNGSPLNLKFDQGNYDNSSDLQTYYRMGDGFFDDKANGVVHDQGNAATGSELNDGTWTANGGWSVSNGVATNDGTGSTLTNDILTIGKVYRMTVKFSSYTSGDFSMFLGVNSESFNFNGTDRFTFIARCSGDTFARIKSKDTGVGSVNISDISIKELNNPGFGTELLLVPNFSNSGDLDNTTLTTLGYSLQPGGVTTASVQNGELSISVTTPHGNAGRVFMQCADGVTITEGNTYKVTYTVVSNSDFDGSDHFSIWNGGNYADAPHAVGTHVQYIAYSGTSRNNLPLQLSGQNSGNVGIVLSKVSLVKLNENPGLTSGGVTFSSDTP
tara:strand:- start:198 stop:1796 length:1599 start_codon:yes stop_codon:yes gene_type:complete